jgi:hypothetical protein
MVTSVIPNIFLRQLAINCSTLSATLTGDGMVTPFENADKEPVPKRKYFTTHLSPMLPHAIIDLQHAMTDVANNGVEDFVDKEGKEYLVDGLDKDDDTDDE